ncbi:MAG TPA: S1/P1 Nuclease [Chitinophagaceae bacterium]|nr:S1/P1 Nuclease [Chitinophagaceae bacterium]
MNRISFAWITVVLIGLFAGISGTAMGWGMQGHRIVGEIAEKHLTPKAKKNIRRILGNESIAMCSNWADFIKSNPQYDSLDKSHYINFKAGMTLSEFNRNLAGDSSQNAYNSIVFLRQALKSGSLPDSLKRDYLKLLIHFVGDVHQPLHTGRPEDRGGNRVQVSWFDESVNLHQVWDDKLIQYQKLSYTEYVQWINHATPAQKQLWMKEPVAVWLFESYELANHIYNNTPAQAKLKYKYNYDYVEALNNKLLKAGIRLAGMLNEIFG